MPHFAKWGILAFCVGVGPAPLGFWLRREASTASWFRLQALTVPRNDQPDTPHKQRHEGRDSKRRFREV
jgi:hypothetical protein